MAYEQRYSLAEAEAELRKTRSGHFTVLIAINERTSAGSDVVEHAKITLRAATLEGAMSKAQKHLTTEMETIRAEIGTTSGRPTFDRLTGD